MTIDVSQFLGVFFAESFERLDDMQATLQRIELEDVDADTLERVFRGVHSIKGGSATFGLPEIAEFAHPMVALLEEIRSGRRALTGESRDALLGSLECLRAMLSAKQNGTATDDRAVAAHRYQLQRQLTPEKSACLPAADNRKTDQPAQTCSWTITFRPAGRTLLCGEDPLAILQQLQLLEQASVTADFSSLPRLDDLETHHCYLAWHMQLAGDGARDLVSRLLEWIKEDGELHIQSSAGSSQPIEGPRASATRTGGGVLSTAQDVNGARGGVDDMSIRVSMNEINSLVGKGGELTIARSMLNQFGEELVGNALRAVDIINVSSKKITDIIRLIDEISLRTSLLALNTNIEAARSGEPSRGVATVATEVRNLARRSAGAAQAIRELIRASVQNAASGARFVEEAKRHTSCYLDAARAEAGAHGFGFLPEPGIGQMDGRGECRRTGSGGRRLYDLGKQLTIDNVEATRQRFQNLLHVSQEVAFLGGDLIAIDTAGLQCLCALLRDRATANLDSSWASVSQQLRDVFHVAGCAQIARLPA